MSTLRYINSAVQSTPITIGTTVPEQIGILHSTYEVKEYKDFRQVFDPKVEASTLKAKRGYLVTLQQRISISNDAANSFSSLAPVKSYNGYPVLLIKQINPKTDVVGFDFQIEDYHPKTLNASVSTSANQSTTAENGNSIQYTSGSSTAVTNSYEISDSVGFFGADMTGSVSASIGQSTTSTSERSMSRGNTRSQAAQDGSASSMTVKDWASYAYLDGAKQQLSWVWGQEYPWNVIDFRGSKSATDATIDLPAYVQDRLFDTKTVFPPSELSQFGLDFVGSARWIFILNGNADVQDETVSFDHCITYWEASHGASNGTFEATIAPVAVNQAVDRMLLNLPLLALDPIIGSGARNGAVLGFVGTEFLVSPSKEAAQFRTKSKANNLYAVGTGFDLPLSEDAAMSSPNITAKTPSQIKLFFKVVDDTLELTLYLKHWKLFNAGCVITLAINEIDPRNPVAPIVRHVDALELSSGTDNVTAITLRNTDFSSNDFHDYLVTGLNTIVITVTPADGANKAGYALRAVAIS